MHNPGLGDLLMDQQFYSDYRYIHIDSMKTNLKLILHTQKLLDQDSQDLQSHD